MNRYNYTKITKRFDGKRIYTTTYYPSIPFDDSDMYITTNISSMLDTLANQYYKDPSLWWVIYRANSLRGGGLGVPAGMQLRIPINVQPILDQFAKMNK